jgi:hypothetical protein
MTQDSDQFRLAMTVFDETASLVRTIGALVGEGFERAQFCLVASEATMAGLSQTMRADCLLPTAHEVATVDGWRLLGAPQPAVAASARMIAGILDLSSPGAAARAGDGDAANDAPVSATGEGVTGEAVNGTSIDRVVRRGPGGHVPGRHRAELSSQVRRGGVVLVVAAGTPAQHRQSVRILLDASAHSVRTYTFPTTPVHVTAGSHRTASDT